MKDTTKKKLEVILYALLMGLLFYLFKDRYKELSQKIGYLIIPVFSVIMYGVNANRILYFNLVDDVLITRQIFSKQKQYSLKAVSSWTETQYNLGEVNTSLVIALKMNEGTKLRLSKRNSKDFEKLSSYLNENIPDAFENK
ncbi:hypothetical protein [uncultured Flavobacterium sp.]|uniref:hypothetical protein n=1 Tax=uncultured Flavobacterium sp. TaxID=165435 RepID=UPI003081F097